ncbi:PHP domain-containing protein [endosymbiont GvMRE of Glomus versiforme]|uniref:PHP domain-containing protein n=1 Tax=endosymbiont GvMRE of Glomus versiforme TaxID=2039283 RepID=UPI000ECA3F70|nr:PHP domain-containing protein [endosymbiont GvMRE of Glomus versiforme]RHZ36986.1 DNA-directed DNA polymerase [endosymbiont GvMRE of Glomus versiforme]
MVNSNFGSFYVPHLNVQTNSNLSFSLIKVSELIDWVIKNNGEYLAIADYYPYEFLRFYNLCKERKIKPVIGIKVITKIGEKQCLVTIYPQNGSAYKELIKKLFNASSLDQVFLLEDVLSCQNNCLIVFSVHNLKDIVYFSQQSFFLTKEKANSQIYLGFDFHIKEPKKELPAHILPYLLPFFAVKTLAQEDVSLLESLFKTSLTQSFLSIDTRQKFISYLSEKDFFPFCTNDKLFYGIILTRLKDFLHRIELKFSFSSKSVVNKNDFTELKSRCEQALFYLTKSSREKYEARLEEELQIINKLGYTRYFLIFSDIINDLRKQNIIVGPGRGSAVSSLVAYLLGITKIDPLEYNLFFERFLNEKRKSPPDIDIDIENQKEVINYLQNKYGRNQIARVATRQKVGWKKAFQESAKIINYGKRRTIIDENQLKEIMSCVKDETLKEDLKTKALQTKFSTLFALAGKIKSFYFNSSLHASGFVISENKKKPLTQLLPLQPDKDCLISYYSEKELNFLGLKKYDFLNLTSLGTLQEIKKILGEEQLPKCNLRDKNAWKLLSNGLVSGIPQLDTVSFRELINYFQPQTFADLVLILALNRPGARKNIEIIREQKLKNQRETFSSPELNQILSETYGSLVFEEQISQIFTFIFNCSFAEGEIYRRNLTDISKKRL